MVKQLAAVTAAAAALVLAGCSSSGGGTSAGSGGGSKISVSSGVLVGGNGHTLYVNTVDTASHISCVGSCATHWPPVAGPAKLGSGLSAADFGTVKRPDGSEQETYQGHPLYEFANDHSAGQHTGNGFQDNGGTWHTATIGAAMPSSGPATSASSSGGYNY